nr:MAG TPA: putative cellulose synthase A catalytic synthase [Bacteriophage sp.]DAH17761.1 MAG TPA: putative cellulose synthase [Caudoviricetes sp.]
MLFNLHFTQNCCQKLWVPVCKFIIAYPIIKTCQNGGF